MLHARGWDGQVFKVTQRNIIKIIIPTLGGDKDWLVPIMSQIICKSTQLKRRGPNKGGGSQ